MFGNTEHSKQLYVPDFKLWDSYYKAHKGPTQESTHTCAAESKENRDFKVKLISPVSETVSQAESIMKTHDSKAGKKLKSKTGKAKKKATAKKQNQKKKNNKNPAFSYRKLSDIFSKGKKLPNKG